MTKKRIKKSAKLAKSTKKPRSYYVRWQIIIGVIGLILSIVLHELFHVVMHMDQVEHIGLFPSHDAIVQINVWLPPGYDIEGEEIIAYTITFAVMLLTAAIVLRIHDAADERTTAQILFPKDKDMQNLSPQELLEIADRANAHQIIHADHRKKGRL